MLSMSIWWYDKNLCKMPIGHVFSDMDIDVLFVNLKKLGIIIDIVN